MPSSRDHLVSPSDLSEQLEGESRLPTAGRWEEAASGGNVVRSQRLALSSEHESAHEMGERARGVTKGSSAQRVVEESEKVAEESWREALLKRSSDGG